MKNTRKDFIKKSLLLAAAVSAGGNSFSQGLIDEEPDGSDELLPNSKGAFTISLFSKHFSWLGYTELAAVAKEAGFDGIDLTVRPGGHVLPEKVKTDLPIAVEAIRRAGLDVYIISTGITDADDPLTGRILKTAASLGIHHYRMAPYYYNPKKTIQDNLKVFETRMRKLAMLNGKYKIFGEYQNHSLQYDPGVNFGAYFGSTIWDLYTVLKNINSKWLGAQYDICHATIECTRSWGIGLELLTPYIKSIHVKDYVWVKKGTEWDLVLVPIGEGMVDYKKFFGMVKQSNVRVPFTFYYGYPIGSEKDGVDMPAIKKGLESLKVFINATGIGK